MLFLQKEKPQCFSSVIKGWQYEEYYVTDSHLWASVLPLTMSKEVLSHPRSLWSLKCSLQWLISVHEKEMEVNWDRLWRDIFHCLIFINCQGCSDDSGIDMNTGINVRWTFSVNSSQKGWFLLVYQSSEGDIKIG